jgi:repressor LexA
MGTHDELSERQRKLLLFIEDYIEQHGRPPTNREIGNGMGIPSTGHVDYHLKALEAKGYIKRESRTSRGIKVLTSLISSDEHELHTTELNGIPIMGTIAAGQPLDLFQGQPEVVGCVSLAYYSDKAYALRVKGDSMIEDGIFEGDYVIVEPTTAVNTRDIIVATNRDGGEGGAATLKRFFREGRSVRLQPANSNYQPIVVDAKEWNRSWEIQGRVAAVIRSYKEA